MTTSEQRVANVDAEVRNILVRAAGVDREVAVGANTETLADLGLDSLAAMELQAVVKSDFAVELPDQLLELSVPEITDLIRASFPGR